MDMIKDLQPKQNNVNVTGKVTEKGNVREFQKFGKPGRVCNVIIKDDSGSITLALWNEDVDKFSVGDTVSVVNGFVSEWQGQKQLGTGRLGTLEKK